MQLIRALSLSLLSLFAGAASADEPQQNLALDDAQRLRIREVEYQGQKVLVQIYQIQQQLAQVKQHGQQLEQQLDATVTDIAKQNHVDQKKYDFNLDTLAWTEKAEKKP